MQKDISLKMYSRQAVRHFMSPSNTQPLKDLTGIGCASSDTLEDLMELSIRVDESGRIDGVRCRTIGCPAAVASGSAFSELLDGKTLDEALALEPEDVLAVMGGLPEQRIRYVHLPLMALEAAVENYRERSTARPGHRARHFSHRRLSCQAMGSVSLTQSVA